MKKVVLLAGVVMIGMWSGQAHAQAIGSSAPAAAGNDLLISLYNQLESLQQEVQTLRGLVEDQSNRLRRLETETRDRYLDMDSRLSALSAGSTAAPGSAPMAGDALPGTRSGGPAGDVRTNVASDVPAAAVPAVTQVPPSAPATLALDAVTSQMSEQDLYRTALNLLLEEGKSEESVAMFQAYLQRFPQGRLLPNALYWQGEALILLARYPEARIAFDRVLNEFPADAKAAGAMLKIGVVQNLQGNRSEAERIWRDLPARFPDSASEITLARDYLSRP
jgi:tol-pal system protein YbgF